MKYFGSSHPLNRQTRTGKAALVSAFVFHDGWGKDFLEEVNLMDGEDVYMTAAEALQHRMPWPTTLNSLPKVATVKLKENADCYRKVGQTVAEF